MKNLEIKIEQSPIKYEDALQEMQNRVEAIIDGSKSELLWFLEHENVYTAGTSAVDSELLNKFKDIPIFQAGRGGRHTYHGPGQRVIYVMLDLEKRNLQDLKKFIQLLEQWIIETLQKIDLNATVKEGRVGIWVEQGSGLNPLKIESKIAAIGIRVKKWVTYHGVSINVSPNLDYFNGIIPCGLHEFGVTSLKDLGVKVSMENLDTILLNSFEEFFGTSK